TPGRPGPRRAGSPGGTPRTGGRRRCRSGRTSAWLLLGEAEGGLEVGLRHRADGPVGDLPVLEDGEERDALHPVARREVAVLVDVQLADDDVVAALGRDLLEDRCD